MTSIKVALFNLEFGEVITLTFSLALIFLVFNISLSLVFQQLKGSIFKEGKFWLLIVLLLSLLGIIFLKK